MPYMIFICTYKDYGVWGNSPAGDIDLTESEISLLPAKVNMNAIFFFFNIKTLA